MTHNAQTETIPPLVPVRRVAGACPVRSAGGIGTELAVNVRGSVLPAGGEQCVRWREGVMICSTNSNLRRTEK